VYKLFKTYIPALSMSFTFIVLYAAIMKIANGELENGFPYFIIKVIGYLVAAIIVDYVVGKINFKKYIYHFAVETSALYPITIAAAIWGKWFSISVFNIVWYSLLYIIVMIVMHYYFFRISKKQADEINELLKARRSK